MLVVVTNMIKMKIKKKGDFMSISKIRFKGYDNSLERKTIGDITTSFSGGTPKSSNKAYYEGNIPFIRSGEIKSKQTELFISDDALKDSSAKMVEKGDILYALYGATSGEVAISQINGAINQAILAIKPNSGYSSEFIMNYLKKEKDNILEKYLQGGQGNLSAAIVKSIELHLPSQEEQTAIGSLFRTLDDLLASYKDNLANYQSLKATMLSKMFSKAGQTVPEIRLDGFEGEWEKSKLKDVAHRVQGNDGRMALPTLTISASGGWMNQIDRFSANIAGKEQKNYTLLKKGELSYNHGNSKLAKYGVVFELQDYEEALVPKVYHSFRVNQLADAKFIEIMFSTKIPDRELGKLVSSGARMDGLLNISFDDFMNITIIIPTIEEQQAIGSYFSNLDNLITAHQEKISQLETLKKKLLQDMFI